MNGRRIWVGSVALVMAGTTVIAMSPSAWAGLPKPTISVTDPGGDNGPLVQGLNFTPGGTVKLTEWAVGTTTPYEKWTTKANSSGDIYAYGDCDGNNQLVFRAKNITNGKRSTKSAPAEYPCIG